MKNIADQIVLTTVRIETRGPHGSGYGTGFLCKMNDQGSSFMPTLITNKHVLKGAKEAAFYLPTSNVGPAQRFILGNLEANWTGHPDEDVDLAAIVLTSFALWAHERGNQLGVTLFSMQDVASASYLRGLGAVESILMVGYPTGLWDSVNNRPIVRSGVTATSVSLDFQGRPDFVVDCACFPGSSGSPILLYDPVVYNDGGKLALGPRLKLLGILHSGPVFSATGEIVTRQVPTATSTTLQTKVMINLGYCVRAEKLLWFDENLPKMAIASSAAVPRGDS